MNYVKFLTLLFTVALATAGAAEPVVELQFALYRDGALVGDSVVFTGVGGTVTTDMPRHGGGEERYRVRVDVDSMEIRDDKPQVSVALEIQGRNGGAWHSRVRRALTITAIPANPESIERHPLPGPERAPDAGFSLQAQALVWGDPEEAAARCRELAGRDCHP